MPLSLLPVAPEWLQVYNSFYEYLTPVYEKKFFHNDNDISLLSLYDFYVILKLFCVFSDKPPHFSPAEHCARAIGSDDYLYELFPFSESSIGGNFQTTKWYQYRKMLEQGTEVNYFK